MNIKIAAIAVLIAVASIAFIRCGASFGACMCSDAFVSYSKSDFEKRVSGTSSRSFLILPDIRLPFGFREIIPSWNIPKGRDDGYFVLIRTGNEDSMGAWMLAGEWNMEVSHEEAEEALRESGAEGDIKGLFRNSSSAFLSDYLVSDGTCDRFGMIFVFNSPDGADKVSRVCAAASNMRGDRGLPLYEKSPVRKPVELKLPFRSQGWEDPKIAGHVCSIVSTCTIMEYFGRKVKTSELASIAYDRRNDMYGMWWKACASASLFGFRSEVRHFRSLDDAYSLIADGIPVAACIAFGDDELEGSATVASDGHVIVIAGFDSDGNVICYDGAFRRKEDGIVAYDRDEFEKAWLVNGGGVGYVIRPDERKP